MIKSLSRLWLLTLATLGLSAAVHAAPGDPPAYSDALTRAFDPAFAITVDDAPAGEPPRLVPVTFRKMELGRLIITTGQIVADDPFVNLGETKLFLQAVPNGEQPVELAVINGSIDDGRIAFARVVFWSQPAIAWKPALVAGQDVKTLKADEIFGYPVDAGTGSFYDPLVGRALSDLRKKDENVWQGWQKDGEDNGEKAANKPNFFLMLAHPPGNIAMFASGWGDGFYASWFGYDASGSVVALVTDFQVIDWESAKW